MIRVGLIGTGHWGPNVANSFKATGRAEITWICDAHPDVMDALAKSYPRARTTVDYLDVIADPAVDAVAVVTPTATHFDIACRALNAGKHVLVEKPITTDAAQTEALIASAKKAGRVLMVGHVFSYNATVLALKDLVRSSALGRISHLNLVTTNLGPVRTDVSALWDLASHDVYMMMELLDEQPESVSAVGRSYLNADVEDVVFSTFIFSSGIIAHVHASWLDPRKVRQITVVGDRKMAVWDDLNAAEPIRVFDKHVETPPCGALEGAVAEYKTLVVDAGSQVIVVAQNRPLQAECEHFIDCIEKNLNPRSDGYAGLAVVRVLFAAQESMRRGGAPVTVGR